MVEGNAVLIIVKTKSVELTTVLEGLKKHYIGILQRQKSHKPKDPLIKIQK